MLGFRLNKLGAAMRNGLDLRSLYGGESYGFLPYLNSADHNRQTYNAPATTAASAGDPVGLWMPQAPGNASVTNLLLWTDAFDNAAWGKYSAVTVTANVAANPDGVPTADLLTATGADGVCSQDAAVTAGTDYTFSVYLRAASNTTLTIYIFNASFVTLGSAVCNVTTSWQRFTVAANSGANTTMRVAIGGGSTFSSPEAVYASKAQLNLGSTALDYQPNAGSLGGSNRRTGGSNMLLRTEEVGNATSWSLNNVTATLNDVANSDGNMRGSTVAASASNAYLSQLMAPLAGTYTLSIEAKATAAGDYLGLVIQPQYADRVGARFDLNAGTVVGASIPGGSASVLIGATIESKGNGWYRCTLAATIPYNANCRWYAGSSDSTQSNTDPFGSVTLRTIRVSKAMVNIGSAADTYSRNMDQLGGLLQSAVLFQSTSADRGTRARRPASGIRNRLTYTEQFDNAAWTKTNTTVTVDATAGPFDGGTADALLETTANNVHTVAYPAFAVSNGSTTTLSLYVKANGRDFCALYEGITGKGKFFSIPADGTGAVLGNLIASPLSATISYLSNGWYRIQIAVTAGATTNLSLYLSADGTTFSYTGDAAKGAYVIAAQLEVSASASEYQKVTSAADITESGQPDVWHTYWDGTSDYGTFGVQSFGTASLFAAAGQAWTVWGVFRTTNTAATTQVLISKAATVTTNATLFAFVIANELRVRIRGTLNSSVALDVADGEFHVWAMRWNGSAFQLWFDRAAAVALTVGTAAEESADILVSARVPAAPEAHFPGHNDVATIDRALSDAEMSQLMSNLNATYRAGL